MEYADAGNLADYIWPSARRSRVLSDEQVWKCIPDCLFMYLLTSSVFVDVLLGLNYLHSVGIVHRDLKPQNLVLASTTDSSSGQQGYV